MKKIILLLACLLITSFSFSQFGDEIVYPNGVGKLPHDTFLNTGDMSGIGFKAGTVPKLNDNGKVISGTLANDTYLNLPGGINGIGFKAGTVVKFNDMGKVISGTLSHDTFLNTGDMSGIGFKAGTVAIFNSKGKVINGTLLHLTYLNLPGGIKGIGFKEGTLVTFNDMGKVINGTLSNDIYLNSPGNGINLKAGTNVTFNENGKVINQRLEKSTYVLSGRQTGNTPGINARLYSDEVDIKEICVLTQIEGNNGGFWIEKNYNLFKLFNLGEKDKAIGLKLDPGKYVVYPMLKKDQTEASVRITLESK